MPRSTHVCLVLAALSVAALSAAGTQTAPAKRPRPGATITLTGCIGSNPEQPGGFTLSDTDTLSSYRLTGTDVRSFLGQRVRVSGVAPRRWRIVGGLFPSPNIAAQGGHDPVKSAMAATDANAASGRALSELRVRSVQAIPGTCPEE